MIVDRLENLSRYQDVLPGMGEILARLSRTDLMALPAGKTVWSPGLYVLRETYLTKPLEDCVFEAHVRYADLQMVLSGTEAFGYRPKDGKGYSVKTPYDPEKDVEKYGMPAVFTRVVLEAGMFALAFPQDLHLPKMAAGESIPVEKAVLKIRLSEE